jgi:molybdopterin converting factor small subunit
MTEVSPAVKILFFSALSRAVGQTEMSWPGSPGLTVEMVWQGLVERFPQLAEWEGKVLIALDQEYVTRQTYVAAGQELALMPPVQGG